ncbi:signal peptidase I [Duganella sp. FT92W]|uniref:Signal peptidase I n=1 Tax=Pseudoduganella rivuli TaxID=2666085 RepID=A0A7X2IQ33_9BURK|nr:signal peptidase I [Pseudoduganella rivuli]MRV73975.1 signal peptidase I [Pseudoduganella rivuli]
MPNAAAETSPNWKPKPWIAVALSMLTTPLSFLYVRKPWHALLFAVAALSLGGAEIVALGRSNSLVSVIHFTIWAAAVFFAYRFAKRAAPGNQPWYARWYGLAGIFSVVISVFCGVRVFFYEPFVIPSMAMQPSLEVGNRILVQKWGFGHLSTWGLDFGRLPASQQLQRGDVVVFDYPSDPSQTYVKRLVGLPGDRIVYRDKHVFVNGQDTYLGKAEDYLQSQTLRYQPRQTHRLGSTVFDVIIEPNAPLMLGAPKDFPLRESCAYTPEEIRCTVPDGRYFVMGDNRDNSADSRYWGFVRADQMIGKVAKVFR